MILTLSSMIDDDGDVSLYLLLVIMAMILHIIDCWVTKGTITKDLVIERASTST